MALISRRRPARMKFASRRGTARRGGTWAIIGATGPGHEQLLAASDDATRASWSSRQTRVETVEMIGMSEA